ncbi:Phosphate-repressible phosphate permease pho-4 [Linum perenne]
MSREKVSIDLATRVVGSWKDTYVWIPILGAFAAVALAFSTGANNIPAPVSSFTLCFDSAAKLKLCFVQLSTAVGSGALTLFKATIAAFFIYLPGAALTGDSPIDSLFSHFLQDNQPNEAFLLWSMTVVLITAAIWLAIATYFELPVSSQQSMQDALLGTIIGVQGFRYIPIWNKDEYHRLNVVGMLWMVIEWAVAPLAACISGFCIFALLKKFVLKHEKGDKRIFILLPIGYGVSAGLLCHFLVFEVLRAHVGCNIWVGVGAVSLATLFGALLSRLMVIKNSRGEFEIKETTVNLDQNHNSDIELQQDKKVTNDDSDAKEEEKPEVDVDDMLNDFMQMRTLETVYEEEERSTAFSDTTQDQDHSQSVSQSIQLTSFKQLLECKSEQFERKTSFQIIKETALNNRGWRHVKETAKAVICPAVEYDRPTLIRHALAEKYDELEDLFWLLHLIASCIFAFIQSSTEIGALAGPYGAIVDVFQNREKYSENFTRTSATNVTWWSRVMGGFVAAMGFFFCGWRLTQVLGLKLTYVSNSRGLVAQLSAVAAVLVVMRINFPASCVHAFVGSTVGVGIADNRKNVNWRMVGKFVGGWGLTTLFCSGLGYVMFSASIHSPSYVVP